MKIYPLLPLVLNLALGLILSGCVTPTSPTGASSPAGIKWDGNTQDAGIDAGTSAGLPCTDAYREEYLRWLPLYGAKCNAPANPFTPIPHGYGGGPWRLNWLITAEGAQDYETMDRASKFPLPSPSTNSAPGKAGS
jgi:hypothetical protein